MHSRRRRSFRKRSKKSRKRSKKTRRFSNRKNIFRYYADPYNEDFREKCKNNGGVIIVRTDGKTIKCVSRNAYKWLAEDLRRRKRYTPTMPESP